MAFLGNKVTVMFGLVLICFQSINYIFSINTNLRQGLINFVWTNEPQPPLVIEILVTINEE